VCATHVELGLGLELGFGIECAAAPMLVLAVAESVCLTHKLVSSVCVIVHIV